MMKEQGAESIHVEFNVIKERHRNQLHERVEKLHRVVVEHLLKTAPCNHTRIITMKSCTVQRTVVTTLLVLS